jgi:hypothetical protein
MKSILAALTLFGCAGIASTQAAPSLGSESGASLASSGSTSVQFPLRLSDDSRYLVDAGGRPFLVVGDTAWSMIAQLKPEVMGRYLDDRQRRGFNSIIVNLIEHKFASKAPANLDGVSPFARGDDFTQPNAEYFKAAHRAVEAAQARGISVWLCPAYLGWGGGDEGFFKEAKAAGPAALHSYGRYIGQRFKDLTNIVWLIGGDYALPENARWAGSELALGLREGGAAQLITAHGGQTTATETFGDQTWLGFETVYRYQPDLWRPLLAAYGRNPIRPFVLIETVYEGEHDSKPEQIRRQAWWAMLCGACGQFFGNNPIWHFDGPTLFPHTNTWEQALDSVGTRDMARLGKILSALPWHRLVPESAAQIIVVGPGDGATRAVAARTADGRFAMAYIPADGSGQRELGLDLSAFPLPLKARWVNPARDVPPLVTAELLANRPQQSLRTPGDNGTGANDWVLVLEVQK